MQIISATPPFAYTCEMLLLLCFNSILFFLNCDKIDEVMKNITSGYKYASPPNPNKSMAIIDAPIKPLMDKCFLE